MEFREDRHSVFTGLVSLGPDPSSLFLDTGDKRRGSVDSPLLENGEVAVKTCRHGMMMYHKKDPYVGKALNYYGEWNETEISFLGQFVSAGAIVLDIGAHIGGLTVPLSRLAGNEGGVYAFEPRKYWYQMLGANIALNGTSRVRTFQNAVGRETGTFSLDSKSHILDGWDDTDPVRVFPIDAMNLTRCDFIRIDTGGMEADVLAGGLSTISSLRPVIYIKNNQAERSRAIIETLIGLDYRFWWHVHSCFNPDNHEGRLENLFAGYEPEIGLLGFHRDRRMDFMGRVLPVEGPGDTRFKASSRAKGQRYYVHSQGNMARLLPIYHKHADAMPAGSLSGSNGRLSPDTGPADETKGKDGWDAVPEPVASPTTEDLASALLGRRNPMALASMHDQSGRWPEAAALFRQVLQDDPNHLDAAVGLARSLFFQKKFQEAEEAITRALNLSPDLHEAYLYQSEILLQKGRLTAAREAVSRAMDLEPGQPRYHAQMATILTKMGKSLEAVECLEKAVRLDPQNRAYRNALRDNVRNNISNIIPAWHFRMLNDQPRNQAFEDALGQVIRPGETVLEIGTGSGLLSMMAARYGAGAVYTCETIGVLAEKARVIVARNGFNRQVEVINKKSSDLVVGRDFPEKADLLVMEIFSSELLAEHVLPSIEDAKNRLLKPGAGIIPGKAGIRACLFGSPELEIELRVDQVSGFDLRPFNEFSPPKYVEENLTATYELLSSEFDVFKFDFVKSSQFPSEKA